MANFCEVDLGNPVPFSITNNNSVSGVSISGGSFEKISGVAGKDTITINFNVDQTLRASSTILSETAKIQTTVQVR